MKKLYKLFTLAYLCMQMSVPSQAGYILVVGSTTDDQSVLDILTEEGYTVVRGLDYSGELTPDKMDSVNNADLVIFSRNGATIEHGEAEAIMQQWADAEAPIISLSPWIMRNNRWRWINSTALDCHFSDSIAIPSGVQSHEIFNGVDVSTGFLEVLQPGTTRNEKFLIDDGGTPVDAGTGIILAQDPTDDGIIAAEWSKDEPFYIGGDITAPVAGSARMWLGFVVEGDNCIQDGNIMSAFNGNDAAKTIFLNAVAYMIGTDPSTVSSVQKSLLSVFPNPATDLLTIRGLNNTPVNYQIIDITGSVILSGFTNESIDISTLSKGMYILKTDGPLSVKFVKR
ncbi:MAG: T9SS type A sorting domain-containing protein [Bacteroidales bacterium]|jgi:hypothetical protein